MPRSPLDTTRCPNVGIRCHAGKNHQGPARSSKSFPPLGSPPLFALPTVSRDLLDQRLRTVVSMGRDERPEAIPTIVEELCIRRERSCHVFECHKLVRYHEAKPVD